MNTKLKNLITNLHDIFFENAERKAARLLEQRANKEVQIREYNGRLWLCYRDMPLVENDWVQGDLAELAVKARRAWFEFKSKENR